MIKIFLHIILLAVLHTLLSHFISWWWIGFPLSFLYYFFYQRSVLNAIRIGFAGIGLSWFIYNWGLQMFSGINVADTMAYVFPLKGYGWAIFIIDMIIGGILGLLGSLSAYYLMAFLKSSRRS